MITNASTSLSRKRATDSFIHEWHCPQSYRDVNSQTSYLFEIFKFNSSGQNYLNIQHFVNRVAITKIRSALCKLAVVTENWDKFHLKNRTFM